MTAESELNKSPAAIKTTADFTVYNININAVHVH